MPAEEWEMVFNKGEVENTDFYLFPESYDNAISVFIL